MTPDAADILELVTPHWDNPAPLIEGRDEHLAGCDVDCFKDNRRAVRACRVLRRKAGAPAGGYLYEMDARLTHTANNARRVAIWSSRMRATRG